MSSLSTPATTVSCFLSVPQWTWSTRVEVISIPLAQSLSPLRHLLSPTCGVCVCVCWGGGGGISWRGRNPQAWFNLISAASCPWDWSEMTFPPSHQSQLFVEISFQPPSLVGCWTGPGGPCWGLRRWCLCGRYSDPYSTFIWCYLDECHSIQQTIASPHHNTTLHPFKRDMSERGCKTETRGYAGGAAQDLWNITTWWQTLYQVPVMTWGQDNVLKSWVLSQKQLLCGFYVWMLVWAVIYESNEESLTALCQAWSCLCHLLRCALQLLHRFSHDPAPLIPREWSGLYIWERDKWFANKATTHTDSWGTGGKFPKWE